MNVCFTSASGGEAITACWHRPTNDASVYDSERLANAYARSRPPVHRQSIAAAKTRLQALGVPRATRAADIGCGAGLSTAALEPLAEGRVGLEPVAAMLRHHRAVAPDARFAIGRAEDLRPERRSENVERTET